MDELTKLHEIAAKAKQAVEDAARYKHALGPVAERHLGIRLSDVTREPSAFVEDEVDEDEDFV